MDQNQSTMFKLEVEETSARFLSEIAKWGKFLSIVGFVCIGLLVVIALFAGAFLAAMSGLGQSSSPAMAGGMQMILTITYLLIAALYFFPCLYMLRFSTRMKRALAENNQELLNSSFENLKSCFKFMGIMTIILLSFYAIAILFGIVGSLAA